ncbi:hypothetical protein [Mesotoga sp.]|uniref:hypothetical protein n=1 Tax=Mesotoga sp. TaxID=2053577 RepID=UPI00345F0A13
MYLVVKIVRPITLLIEKIKLIAQGDYKQRLPGRGNDDRGTFKRVQYDGCKAEFI